LLLAVGGVRYFKGSLAREQLKVLAQRHRAHILIAQKEREKVRYSGPLPLLAIIQGMAINGILVSINARLPRGKYSASNVQKAASHAQSRICKASLLLARITCGETLDFYLVQEYAWHTTCD
jgi:hypothetical protein